MRIQGTVIDGTTKEPMFGVNVAVVDKDGKMPHPPIGDATNPDGKYVIAQGVKPTDYLKASSLGYASVTKKVGDNGQNFTLIPTSLELEEFTIVADRDEVGSKARKNKRNYYMVGGLAILLIVGGIITYKLVKK